MPAPHPIGTRRLNHNGYITVKVATGRGPHRDWEFEHRVVWENANGPLPAGFMVHHRNGVKTDNRLENLSGISRDEHNREHADILRANGRRAGLSNKGKPKPPEQRAKMSEAARGRTKSPEHRANLSEAALRWHSEHR